MDRLKQDPDIMTDLAKLKEELGNKIKFQLLLYQYNASFEKNN